MRTDAAPSPATADAHAVPTTQRDCYWPPTPTARAAAARPRRRRSPRPSRLPLTAGPPFPRAVSKTSFLAGLLAAGAVFARIMPSAFEAAALPTLGLFAGGVATGLGTSLANGCTSGHGLCGFSRLSPRSFVAVPIFMGFAAVTATVRSGVYSVGPVVPVVPPVDGLIPLAAGLAAALLAALVPVLLFTRQGSHVREAAVGGWVGLTFGTGLAMGGMARASVIGSALSPAHPNPTLWVLFVTGLVTTFTIYRVAQHYHKMPQAIAPAGGRIDARLMVGSAIFGVGWGTTGVCPGPLLVNLGATPFEPAVLLMLAGVVVGILSSNAYGDALDLVMRVLFGRPAQGAIKS